MNMRDEIASLIASPPKRPRTEPTQPEINYAVKVTFYMPASDPEQDSGLTQEDWDRMQQGIQHIGGYDIDHEVEEMSS